MASTTSIFANPAVFPTAFIEIVEMVLLEDITEALALGILDNTACASLQTSIIRASGCCSRACERTALVLEPGPRNISPEPGAFQFANVPQGTFTGAAVADYDRDGWLDIYFCLYIYYQGTINTNILSLYGRREWPSEFMMRNNRDDLSVT